MKRVFPVERVLKGLAVLGALFLLTFAGWIIVAGPVTVFRIVRYGDTQIDDFLYYPGRHMAASPSPDRLINPVSPGQSSPSILVPAGEGTVNLNELLSENDTTAFLIWKDDQLVYESYYQGHTQSSLSQSFSMAKSFTSALVGMAVEDGYILSIDQPVTDYVPELAGKGFSRVTIRHLLTMTSGSSYQENDNPFGIHVILNYTPELEKEILGFRVEDEPGQVFRYKSGDNALLALILDRALGEKTITEYTQERLWTPLGMEYEGIWSLDHEGDGLEKTWCCLAATARDFLKLGILYLQEGEWNGKRIVSTEWVRASTQVGAVAEEVWDEGFRRAGLSNYGYQWWLVAGEEGSYLANGKDGQYLYVNPAERTVILRLGWSTGRLPLNEWLTVFQYLARDVPFSKGEAAR